MVLSRSLVLFHIFYRFTFAFIEVDIDSDLLLGFFLLTNDCCFGLCLLLALRYDLWLCAGYIRVCISRPTFSL